MLNNIYHTMFKNRNIELPLFIHIIEPIGIIIVNNELLDFDCLGASKIHPSKVLDLLSIMYNDKELQDVLPAEFHPIFKNKVISIFENCLGGIDEFPSPYVFICLKLEMEIKKNKKIRLYNLEYNRKILDSSINLSAVDFFFILANICVEFTAKSSCSLEELQRIEYDIKNVVIPENDITTYNFACNYLQFIGEAFRNRKLNPEYILLNGGVHTLMFLREIECVSRYFEEIIVEIETKLNQIPVPRKLVYFTLFKCIWEEETSLIPIEDDKLNKYEKLKTVERAEKFLLHVENLKKNKPRLFSVLQKLQKNLHLDSYKQL